MKPSVMRLKKKTKFIIIDEVLGVNNIYKNYNEDIYVYLMQNFSSFQNNISAILKTAR